jgi:hypothetical protein
VFRASLKLNTEPEKGSNGSTIQFQFCQGKGSRISRRLRYRFSDFRRTVGDASKACFHMLNSVLLQLIFYLGCNLKKIIFSLG